MNIYQKLQSARIKVQEAAITKTGKNPHQKFSYLELIDFSPVVQATFHELGLMGKVDFAEQATLTIYDTDKPENYLVFTSPMSTAKLPGAHDVQNLGAVQTYLRRYLYMAALEIVAPDHVEDSKPVSAYKPQITTEQLATACERIRNGENIASKVRDKYTLNSSQDKVLKAADDERISRDQKPSVQQG